MQCKTAIISLVDRVALGHVSKQDWGMVKAKKSYTVNLLRKKSMAQCWEQVLGYKSYLFQ